MRVGQLVMAKATTAVCEVGEYGVCYEVYELGGRSGYSIIFQSGRYDGFSPDEADRMLVVFPAVASDVADYQFSNVLRLSVDYRLGVFADAFRLAAQHVEENGL